MLEIVIHESAAFLETWALSTPTLPPTADELRLAPIVHQALEAAWLDSLPGDPTQRHEEGGWIYLNLKNGHLAIRRAPRGQQAELELGDPPLVSDCLVVGIFHTHPNPKPKDGARGRATSMRRCMVSSAYLV